MNIFDLNNKTLELINISDDEATGIHFLLNRMIAEECVNTLQPPDIEVSPIESLKPGEGARLRFGDRGWEMALMHAVTERKNSKTGFCLRIFFTHPLDESQIINRWETQ